MGDRPRAVSYTKYITSSFWVMLLLARKENTLEEPSCWSNVSTVYLSSVPVVCNKMWNVFPTNFKAEKEYFTHGDWWFSGSPYQSHTCSTTVKYNAPSWFVYTGIPIRSLMVYQCKQVANMTPIHTVHIRTQSLQKEKMRQRGLLPPATPPPHYKPSTLPPHSTPPPPPLNHLIPPPIHQPPAHLWFCKRKLDNWRGSKKPPQVTKL